MRSICLIAGAVVAGIWMALPASAGLTAGQVDTFEDGTLQGWEVGAPSPIPPVNVFNGGPAGANDNYLKLVSLGGRGPGSKLTMLNEAQWAGDFTGAGITAIAMDVNNMGNTSLPLRLLFESAPSGTPTDVAITDAVSVGPGSGWMHISFGLDPGHLKALQGSAATALHHTTELRLYENANASFPPPGIVATLGVDNIAAVGGTAPVPEPSSLALLAMGAAGMLARRRGKG